MQKIILDPATSIIRMVFEVAKSAIIESISVFLSPNALPAAVASGASDNDNSFHPTRSRAEMATRMYTAVVIRIEASRAHYQYKSRC
jgi:hypothetical protein